MMDTWFRPEAQRKIVNNVKAVAWALSWVVEWWIIVIVLAYIFETINSWTTVPPIFVVAAANMMGMFWLEQRRPAPLGPPSASEDQATKSYVESQLP